MRPSRLSIFVLLPVVVVIERFTYYAMRNAIWSSALAQGLDSEEIRTLVGRLTLMLVFFPLLGGLLALAILPRWTLVIGACVTAAGYAILGALGEPSTSAFLVLAIGLGLLRPAAYAAAATTVRDPEESLRNALFLGLYCAVNVGSLLSGLVVELLQSGSEETRAGTLSLVSWIAAALLVLAVPLSAAIALAPRFDREPAVPAPRFTGRGEIGAVLVILVLASGWLAIDVAAPFQYRHLPYDLRVAYYLNPVLVIAVSVLGIIGFSAAVFARRRIPALYVIPAGALLVALSVLPLVPIGFGADGEAATALAVVSVALASLGEPLFFGLVLSRAAAIHPRTSALAVAIWLLGIGVVSQLWSKLDPLLERSSPMTALAVLLAAALGTVIGAIALVALQRFGARHLWPADAPAAEEDAAGVLPAPS